MSIEHRRIRILILLVVFPLIGGLAHAQPSANQRAADVDAIFASFDKKDSPGCALAIIQNGTITYQRGYGMADLDHDIRITPSSIFYIASDSKQFTAFSVALLIEQGKVALDDAVTKYFPELPPSVYGSVTVKHLLYHTGGVRDYWSLLQLAGTSVDDHFTESDFVDLMARQKALNFKPGEQFDYSNSGYVLLALLVKRASGESLQKFAEENIFQPLGMVHTFFRDNPSLIVKDRATGYSTRGHGYEIHTTNFGLVGDGGILTTIGDLFLWDQNFYQNKLGKQSTQLLQLVQRRGTLNNGHLATYAFGLGVIEYKGLTAITHNGSAFGYKADMIRFPDQKFSVICLCNTDAPGMTPWAFRKQITDLYLADNLKKDARNETVSSARSPTVEKSAPIKMNVSQLAHYTGTFRDKDGEVWTLAIEDEKLVAAVEGIKFSFEPLSAEHFRAVDAPQPVDLYFPADPLAIKAVGSQVGSQPRSTLESFVPWTPTSEDLSAYGGDYFGEELDATFRVYSAGGKLYVRRKHVDPVMLTSGLKDQFEMGPAKLEFNRDPSGRVLSLKLSGQGVTNIQFMKTP